MAIARELDSVTGITDEISFPPSDLYSDEPPVETELHLRQILILLQCLEWLWRDKNDFYAVGNLTIYYSPQQKKSQDFRGPDFFVVLGTERKTRKSWVVWAENGQYPNVIVEIISPTTANTDKEFKKELYQNIFRTPNYFWFDPYTLELAGFHLVDGKYQPLTSNSQGHLWSTQLELYLGVEQEFLRFFTPEGKLVPRPEEIAEQAEERAEQAEERAGQAEQKAEQAEQKAGQAEERAERLAAKLRSLNIDPETI